MILVATPCRDDVKGGYTYDLVYLLAASRDCVYSLGLSCTYLHETRNMLVERALVAEASHILFIDSDMRFAPDSLNRLLSREKDIVGANYLERNRKLFTASTGSQYVTSKVRSGVEKVDHIGMGLTLIKTDIFYRLPRPWFSCPWLGERHMGEDVYFCRLAKEHGIEVWVDHDVSQTVKHIGAEERGVDL